MTIFRQCRSNRRRLVPWVFAAVAVAVAIASPARADTLPDPVLTWNRQTNVAIQTTLMDPFQATRALALESLVVFDTLRSVSGQAGFLVRLPAPPGVRPDIAAGAAAHTVLRYLFPAQRSALDATLATFLSAIPDDPERARSVAFGAAMADTVIAIRDRDGWNRNQPFPTRSAPGQWRPTPPGFLPPLNPQWARVTPFTLLEPKQFRPPGPPAVGSKKFNDARSLTAAMGEAQSSVRAPDQTQAAHYWSDAIGTYAPAGHWNEIATGLLREEQRDLVSEAKLLAELNVAIADAGIAMADAKYTYWFWRPIAAIRLGDGTFIAQPNWTPLLETPNHPSYVSGHSAFSGAAASVLTAAFGVRAFQAGSPGTPGQTRSFASFEQAAEEAANSRLWGGIHFRFDNDDGLVMGRAVGAWATQTFQHFTDDRGPTIVLGRTGADGFALDNSAPLPSVALVVDGGKPVTVPVGPNGRFMLPVLPAGKHALTLTARSASGQIAKIQATTGGLH